MATSTFESIAKHRWAYDVFVSFGDEDIVRSFTDHLFRDFKRKGIRAFSDEQLVRGEARSCQVDRAIEQSRFLVVVFSENFASSPRCLRELVRILECKGMEPDRHEIQTVFYNVKPAVVHDKTGCYEAAFGEHEASMATRTEVARWKEALTTAGDLPGWDLEDHANGYESRFIDMISIHIFNKLSCGPLHLGENLVGIHSRAAQMNLWRFVGSSGVHMIGICGIKGIGKTTIAKAVYNRLYSHFEGCSFCEDVKGFVKKHGLANLQRQVIEDITKTDLKIQSAGEGSSVMKHIMVSKQVLVVLDDVDQLDQLEALVGSHDWFGQGSLMLVTGKDRQLLLAHGVEEIYEVGFLHDDEAMELFSLFSFRDKRPKENFVGLAGRVVQYVSGHPLALKVLGCFLYGKTLSEWESELGRLQTYPTGDIQVLISRFSSQKKRKITSKTC